MIVAHPYTVSTSRDGRTVGGFAKAGVTRVKHGTPPVRSDELWSLYVLSENHGFATDGACFTDNLGFVLIRMVR